VEKKVRDKTETRDAIIWELDEENRIAWVKIQGSDELVNAHFPQNQWSLPKWARVGNCARVRHRQGHRGYLEVIGEGRAIPKPAIGVAHPEPVDLADAILDGLQILPTSPASMSVLVTSGSYRINGRTYYYDAVTLDFIEMDDPAPMTMEINSEHIMGVGNYTVAIDSPCTTSGEWRYDLLQIGTDVVVDYITGECGVDPAFPEVSENHLQIGDYIFVSWQTTDIEGWNIGYTQDTQVPTWLEYDITAISPASFDNSILVFEWCDPVGCASYPNPEIYITVSVKDQVGYDCYPGGAGFDFTLSRDSGTGQVWSSDDGWSTSVDQHVTADYKYAFKYRRQEASTEYQPAFTVTLDSLPVLSRAINFYLQISGEVMAPPS
jgi:hypothetical protein